MAGALVMRREYVVGRDSGLFKAGWWFCVTLPEACGPGAKTYRPIESFTSGV
jgi:hypothetical protein